MWPSFLLLFIPTLSSVVSIILNIENEKVETNETVYHYEKPKYTEQEATSLILFRPMVENILENDYERSDNFLIRWIRSSDFDLAAAERMIRKAKQWRKEDRVDSIMEEDPLPNSGTLCRINGTSYDGSPVFTMTNAVALDFRKIILAGQKDALRRKVLQCLELVWITLRKINEGGERIVEGAYVIVDAKGLTQKSHGCTSCVNVYLNFVRDAHQYYPEYAKLSVTINVPTFLRRILDLSKQFLSVRALDAMHLFANDRKTWTSFLLQRIPANQLSVYLGGTA